MSVKGVLICHSFTLPALRERFRPENRVVGANLGPTLTYPSFITSAASSRRRAHHLNRRGQRLTTPAVEEPHLTHLGRSDLSLLHCRPIGGDQSPQSKTDTTTFHKIF